MESVKDGSAAGGPAGASGRGAIVILGATSGIARAAAAAWLARGEGLVLAGRSEEDLRAVAADLEVACGRRAEVFAWDVADVPGHAARFAGLAAAHRLRGLFLAAGVMHLPDACLADPLKAAEMFRVNLEGPAVVADLFASHLRSRGGGFVSCVTSVAGDRGRASNYHYGASKAGLSTFLEGLRGRMQGSGVLVQDVKPGPVRTRMTAGLRRGPLMAEPAAVAADIVRAVDAGKAVVYTPAIWRPIMAVIRALPGPLFRRLPL